MGELAALGTALMWAASNIPLKSLSARFHPFLVNHIRSLAAVMLFAAVLLGTGRFAHLSQVPPKSAFITIAGTVIGVLAGESLYVLSLRYIDLSRAYPISLCGYPIATLAIALPFFHEKIAGLAWLGIAIALLGLYLTAFPHSGLLARFPFSSRKERAGLLLVLLSVLLSGVATNLITFGIKDMDLMLANFIRFSSIAVLLTPFTLSQWAKLGAKKDDWQSVGMGALSGTLGFGLGAMLFLFALNSSGAALTSVLSSTSPLFLLPMSALFLKEKVTVKLVAGAVLSVLGICLIFLPKIIS